MPEGPSLVILKEQTAPFVGQEIVRAEGNTWAIDTTRLIGQPVVALRTWGKHFLIQMPTMVVRIHFLLFGTYRVNERRDKPPRLSLGFADGGELNFYACSVKMLEEPLDEIYDWTADVLNPKWDAKKALEKLKKQPDMLVCDALLDQTIFSGVGNIIKNEVLFRIRVHPGSKVGKLPAAKLKELVKEAEQYSYDFLKWKKEFTLKKHWLAHTKTVCPRDGAKIHKEYMGKTNRRTFFCTVCQKLYA